MTVFFLSALDPSLVAVGVGGEGKIVRNFPSSAEGPITEHKKEASVFGSGGGHDAIKTCEKFTGKMLACHMIKWLIK